MRNPIQSAGKKLLFAALAILAVSCNERGVNSGGESDYLDRFLDIFSKNPGQINDTGATTPVTPATYTLTIHHDANGGSVARTPTPNQEKYDAGTRVTITASPKDGYTFNGWLGDFESKDPSIVIKMDGDKTLYANFQQNGTTQTPSTLILFDINGATGNAPAQIKVSYGNSTPLPEPEGVSKPGHRFIGWNTSRDGEGTDYGYGAGASYTFTDEVVILYAKWTLNEYSVIWNTNGGDPAPTQTSVTHGGDIIAPAETMTKTGYRFDGWYTNEALSGTAAAFPINNVTNDRTFYAKWTLNTYTVTFNAGANGAISAKVDGNTISSGATVQHGKNVIFTATPTASSDYGVNVWTRDGNTVAAGDAAYILENISAAATVSVSFVKLTVDKFTVAFNTQDGGATAVNPQSVELNGNVVKPANPNRTGYTFGGWYKEAACTNPWYFETDVVTGATTLYAKWTVNSYAVTWYADGGSPVPTQMSVNHGGSITAPGTMSKNGYTFGGWYTNSALSGTVVTFPINNVTTNTTLSFYAKWTLISYTITFNANGGTVTPSSGTTGDGWKLAAVPTPTRTGYTFSGWFTAETGGTQVTTSSVFSANATIYARWTIITSYTITFNANDGSVSPMSGTTGDGYTLTYLPTPTRTNYTFVGWFTAESYGSEVTTSTVFSSSTSTITIYARWTQGGGSATLINPKNNQQYKTATIGGVVWMAENLNYKSSFGRDTGWCYENSVDSCNKYGRLYNWEAAMNISSLSYRWDSWNRSDVKHQGICPSGWHLPSRAEWDELGEAVGGRYNSITYNSWWDAGKYLKSRDGWNACTSLYYCSGENLDTYGFSALPGGRRSQSDGIGYFQYVGETGYWWTATETLSAGAYDMYMTYDGSSLLENTIFKSEGFSVRCVMDNRINDN